MSELAWRQLLNRLRRPDWVVHARQPLGGPAQVLDYLARYTHRVAISNERLVNMQDGMVAFRVRDAAHPGKKRIERLAAQDFIGRFLLHVRPLDSSASGITASWPAVTNRRNWHGAVRRWTYRRRMPR